MITRIALKVARIEAGLTQKQLADRVGVTQQTIAKWERGVSTPCHFKHMRSLERELKKPIEVLFSDLFCDRKPTA